jgi:predicted short-subunit dehydrogenase-like oxidoreductase (DUF2520 family)
MKYSVIGTGNTAWFIAKKMYDAGHQCTAIYGRDGDKTTALANTVSGTAKLIQDGVADDVDVCIIAISDNAIAEVCKYISLTKTLLLHTAGAVSIEVLQEAAINYGVLWPIYSIVKNNLPDTRNIPTVFETNTVNNIPLLSAVAQSFTDILYEADSDKRKTLHVAAVFSNNFTNHLFSIAKRICEEKELPFALLLPIIQQTVSRIENTSPELLQTGPAKRGDIVTQTKHLQLLQNNENWGEVYKAISASIAAMYKQKD